MNETNNIQFAHDAVNIYVTILLPLLTKIRNLKYNENFVIHNDDMNTCNLVQNRYSISSLSFSSFQNKVVTFNVGYQPIIKVGQNIKTQKKQLIIESSDSSLLEKPITEITQINVTDEIPRLEPVYGEGKDGIKWNNPEYDALWNKLPVELKNGLKTEHDWMVEFMFNCVNSRARKQACKFTQPPNLIIPPNILENGKYDFGVNIYNDIFNKLPNSLKDTYLTMYSQENGNKNYNMLRDEINKLVEKEIKFNGYF